MSRSTRSPSLYNALSLAAATALFAGFIDVSLAMVARPATLSSWPAVIPPLAATCAAVFLAYMAAWLVLAVLRRPLDVRGPDGAAALAVFVGVLVVVQDFGHTAPFVRNPYRLFIALGLASAASMGVSAAVRRAATFAREGQLAARGVALVIALGVIANTNWFFHYSAGASLSTRGLVVLGVGGRSRRGDRRGHRKHRERAGAARLDNDVHDRRPHPPSRHHACVTPTNVVVVG